MLLAGGERAGERVCFSDRYFYLDSKMPFIFRVILGRSSRIDADWLTSLQVVEERPTRFCERAKTRLVVSTALSDNKKTRHEEQRYRR